MAWIELHQSLTNNHRKVIKTAAALKLQKPYVIGHLVCLWTWALDNTPDGILPNEPALIAEAAQWRGDEEKFFAALMDAPWIDDQGDGTFYLHDWHEYAGKLIERRERNREQMRRARVKHVGNTCTTRVQHVSDGEQNTCKATVPNQTVPKRAIPKSSNETATTPAPAVPPPVGKVEETGKSQARWPLLASLTEEIARVNSSPLLNDQRTDILDATEANLRDLAVACETLKRDWNTLLCQRLRSKPKVRTLLAGSDMPAQLICQEAEYAYRDLAKDLAEAEYRKGNQAGAAPPRESSGFDLPLVIPDYAKQAVDHE